MKNELKKNIGRLFSKLNTKKPAFFLYPVAGVPTSHTCESNVDIIADAFVVGEDTNHGARIFSKLYIKKSAFFLCFLLLCSFQQPEADDVIYLRKIQNAQGSALDDFTLNIAKSFLNRPYKAHTLEGNSTEKLVVNLREFDCTTFVETCIAMGLTYRKNDISFDKFENYLKRLRYYNKGKIKGYESRIHYMSDWLYTHNNDGLMEDITPNLGGIEWKKNINFMSTHWNKYPPSNNSSIQEKIQKIEERISEQNYTYVPKNKVKSVENQLLNGDIIAITTNIQGLDITHTGFAIRLQDKRVYLLHASSENKRVMVTDKPLAEYLAKNKTQTGIMVARLK